MYTRRNRSHRRSNDDLYQARLHQRIQQRLEESEASRKPLSYEELGQRAGEALSFKCEHTFIHPTFLLHLIEMRKRYLKLRDLVETHWQDAEAEFGGSYCERDLNLWANALNWHDRKQE